MNPSKKLESAARKREREYERLAEQLRKKVVADGKRATAILNRQLGQRRGTRHATRGQGTWVKSGRTVSLLLKIHSGGRIGDMYASKQAGADSIDTNMLGLDPVDRQSEFLLDQAKHPRVNPKNLFIHLSLSRPKGHDLHKDQWKSAVQRFLKKIGADGNYVVVRHAATGNDHVHVIFSRSKKDGSLVSLSQNRWAWRQRVREVESELDIEVTDFEANTASSVPTSDKLVSAQRRALRRGSSVPSSLSVLALEAHSRRTVH